jgi:hypothetical protein
MATPPTIVSFTQSATNFTSTTSKQTTVSVQVGDLIVVWELAKNYMSYGTGTSDTQSNSYTNGVSYVVVANRTANGYAWTEAGSTGSVTITSNVNTASNWAVAVTAGAPGDVSVELGIAAANLILALAAAVHVTITDDGLTVDVIDREIEVASWAPVFVGDIPSGAPAVTVADVDRSVGVAWQAIEIAALEVISP